MSVGEGRKADLNRVPVGAHARLGDAIGCVVALYDFTKQGGAIGTITLPVKIPKNAVVMHTIVDVIIQPVSTGSATVSVGLGASSAAILALTAKASLTVAQYAGIQDNTISHSLKVAVDSAVTVSIAVAALTAGKIAVAVYFFESTDNTSLGIVE